MYKTRQLGSAAHNMAGADAAGRQCSWNAIAVQKGSQGVKAALHFGGNFQTFSVSRSPPQFLNRFFHPPAFFGLESWWRDESHIEKTIKRFKLKISTEKGGKSRCVSIFISRGNSGTWSRKNKTQGFCDRVCSGGGLKFQEFP